MDDSEHFWNRNENRSGICVRWSCAMKKFFSNLIRRKKTFLGIILAIVIGLVSQSLLWLIMAIQLFPIIEIPFRSRSPELEG